MVKGRNNHTSPPLRNAGILSWTGTVMISRTTPSRASRSFSLFFELLSSSESFGRLAKCTALTCASDSGPEPCDRRCCRVFSDARRELAYSFPTMKSNPIVHADWSLASTTSWAIVTSKVNRHRLTAYMISVFKRRFVLGTAERDPLSYKSTHSDIVIKISASTTADTAGVAV